MSESPEQPSPPPEEPFPDIFQVLNDDADFDVEDSEGQSLDALDQDQDALEGAADIEDLQAELDEIGGEGEPPVFMASVGTDGSWTEQIPVNGVMAPVSTGTQSDYRHFSASDTASGAALVQAGAAALVLQYDDVGSAGAFTRFVMPSPPSAMVYLVAVNATVDATTWIQTLRFPDGHTDNGYNGSEWNGTNSGAIMGNPGSLGGFVGTDGKTTTGCQVKPPGPQGPITATYDFSTARWWIDKDNSAF